MAADRRLHRHLEHLPRNQLLHFIDQFATALVRAVAVNDQGQRIDLLAVDQHVELDQRRGLKMAEFVVKRSIAAARGFQAVEEIEHHFGQRQLILQRHLRAQKLHFFLHPALLAA